jgi:hypothetical protein
LQAVDLTLPDLDQRAVERHRSKIENLGQTVLFLEQLQDGYLAGKSINCMR